MVDLADADLVGVRDSTYWRDLDFLYSNICDAERSSDFNIRGSMKQLRRANRAIQMTLCSGDCGARPRCTSAPYYWRLRASLLSKLSGQCALIFCVTIGLHNVHIF